MERRAFAAVAAMGLATPVLGIAAPAGSLRRSVRIAFDTDAATPIVRLTAGSLDIVAEHESAGSLDIVAEHESAG